MSSRAETKIYLLFMKIFHSYSLYLTLPKTYLTLEKLGFTESDNERTSSISSSEFALECCILPTVRINRMIDVEILLREHN